jgi:hypothetical protein
MQAARRADSLARQPCRVIRGEENHYRGDFLRSAESRAERSIYRRRISFRATDKANPTIAFGVNQARSDNIMRRLLEIGTRPGPVPVQAGGAIRR